MTTPANNATGAKPGITTTEFWVTLITSITGAVSVLAGHAINLPVNVQVAAGIAAAISTAAYAVSRGRLKGLVGSSGLSTYLHYIEGVVVNHTHNATGAVTVTPLPTTQSTSGSPEITVTPISSTPSA